MVRHISKKMLRELYASEFQLTLDMIKDELITAAKEGKSVLTLRLESIDDGITTKQLNMIQEMVGDVECEKINNNTVQFKW